MSVLSADPTMTSPPSSPLDREMLVRVEGVSKKFCRNLKKSLWYGVQDVVGELNPFRRAPGSSPTNASVSPNASGSASQPSSLSEFPEPRLREGEFWANQAISFELRRGECLGLIGHNGAGKTTLLKMLNGLIKPDTGRIEMQGRVGALIALGAGFNPILTGRENIYVNGSILGLSKREIEEKMDEIIDFAEIRDFIDSPVQSYSSGMNVRLGFAVATALNPDVLILDEVLAVGDRRFRAKCMARISRILERAAVILVSHDDAQIRQKCDHVVWLVKGRSQYVGPTEKGLDLYSRASRAGVPNAIILQPPALSVETELNVTSGDQGMTLTAAVKIECEHDVLIDYAVATIEAEGGMPAAQKIPHGLPILLRTGMNNLVVQFDNLQLAPGSYHFSLLGSKQGGKSVVFNSLYGAGFAVEGANHLWASYQPFAAISVSGTIGLG
jgi:ABC-type polysaccharide/polyol phosphate transport system ATPase subunit